MKCGACGAIGSSSLAECEFCGNMLRSSAEPTGSGLSKGAGHSAGSELTNHNPSDFSNYIKDSFSLITDLSKSPSGGFNFAAFFFSIPYLWGYGARDNAKVVATVLLVPQLAIAVIGLLFDYTLAALLTLVQFGWLVYVSWAVSTRVSLLAKRDRPYDWGQGILAFIAYALISGIINSIGQSAYY